MVSPVVPFRIVKKRQTASKIGRLKEASKCRVSKSIRYFANTDALFLESGSDLSENFTPHPIQNTDSCVEIKILVTSPTNGSFCHSSSSSKQWTTSSALPLIQPLDLGSAKKKQVEALQCEVALRENVNSKNEDQRRLSRCAVYGTSSDTSEISNSDVSTSSFTSITPLQPKNFDQLGVKNTRLPRDRKAWSIPNLIPLQDATAELKVEPALESTYISALISTPPCAPAPVLRCAPPSHHDVHTVIAPLREPSPSAGNPILDHKPHRDSVASPKPPVKTGTITSYHKALLRSPKSKVNATSQKRHKLPQFLAKLLPAASPSSGMKDLPPSSSVGGMGLAKSVSMSSLTSMRSMTSNIKAAVVSGLAKTKTVILSRGGEEKNQKRAHMSNVGAVQVKMWIEEDVKCSLMKRQRGRESGTLHVESASTTPQTTPALTSSESFVTDSSLSEDDYVLLWHERRTNQAFSAEDLNLTFSTKCEVNAEDGDETLPSSDSCSSGSSVSIKELLRRCDSGLERGSESVMFEEVPAWATCFPDERGPHCFFNIPLSYTVRPSTLEMTDSESSTIMELFIRASAGIVWELVMDEEPIFD